MIMRRGVIEHALERQEMHRTFLLENRKESDMMKMEAWKGGKYSRLSIVTSTKLFKTAAELMIHTVTVLRNCCNNVNKRTYNGLQLIEITFHCCKRQVLATIDLR
jgi:hypothetical protein